MATGSQSLHRKADIGDRLLVADTSRSTSSESSYFIAQFEAYLHQEMTEPVLTTAVLACRPVVVEW